MITLDIFLQNLVATNFCQNTITLPEKDKKILKSLSNQLGVNKFLTENQGKLLIKILNENKQELKKYDEFVDDLLNFPEWSKSFRVIEQVRKIYLHKQSADKFFIEFSFNKKISLLLNEIIASKQIERTIILNKIIAIPLTESNLFSVIKGLKSYKFDIDETLLEYYKEIEKIFSKKDNFTVTYNSNDKILKALSLDIGENNIQSSLLIADRKIRYGYSFKHESENTLADKIANRTKERVWVSSKKETLQNLLESLVKLKRFPVLFIFDSHKTEECYTNLSWLHSELTKLNKNLNVYFRLDSNIGKNFNQYITDNSLNKLTDKSTDCVVVDNSYLPKFLLKNDWYPSSVISFIPTFRNNKTSAYCNSVDLIVYYTEVKPLISDTDDIM